MVNMQIYKTMVPLLMLIQFLKLYLECSIEDKALQVFCKSYGGD